MEKLTHSNYDEVLRAVRFAVAYVPISQFPNRVMSFRANTAAASIDAGLLSLPDATILARFRPAGNAATERHVFIGAPDEVNAILNVTAPGVYDTGWVFRTPDKYYPVFFLPFALKNFCARGGNGINMVNNTIEMWQSIG
jgi:hypothetical protein